MLKAPPLARHPRHWFFNTAYYAQREPLNWIPRWIEEYGDLFTITSPLGQASVVGRPEWVRHVLADSMTYFPFGAGPRSCIGNHFALQELIIMTATFYRHLRLRLDPVTTIEMEPLITLRPKQAVRFRIEGRRSAKEGFAKPECRSLG